MTRDEFVPILAGITRGVGRPICKGKAEARRQAAEIYFTFLGDLPAYAFEIAAHLAILNPPAEGFPKMFPTIATLRQLAQDVVHYAHTRAIESTKEKILATLQSLASVRAFQIDDGTGDTADLPPAFTAIVATAGGWNEVDRAFREKRLGLANLRHQADVVLRNDDGRASVIRLSIRHNLKSLPAATKALLDRAPAEAAKMLPADVQILLAMPIPAPKLPAAVEAAPARRGGPIAAIGEVLASVPAIQAAQEATP